MTSTPLEGFDPVTRHLVIERDLNPAGNLFGGTVLAWLDESTAVYVMGRIGYTDLVTVSMDDVNFKAPGHRGDIVSIHSRIVRTGSSSVTAETKAFVEEPASGERREMISCTVTFVCLRNRKKYEYFKSPEYRQWLERQGA